MKNSEALTALFEGLEVKHPSLSESILWTGEGEFCSSISGLKVNGADLLYKFPTGWELVEEKEPPLVLCPADVGRRVRLENGDIVLVIWCNKKGDHFGGSFCGWDKFGEATSYSSYNIKELLK